jgi:putative hemolysin
VKARTLGALYERIDRASPERFAESSLNVLAIDSDCAAADLSRLPREGPLLIVANHPHGAADGLLLAAALVRVRSDVRLLANHLLARIPELRHSCFFVDPFDGPGAAARSRTGLREAHLWLKRGGALVVFPAGEVARRRGSNGVPVDSEWRDTVGRLALHTGAQVVPAFVEGGNSALFYAVGRLHPALRTALLPRELLKKRGRRISLRLGEPVSARRLAGNAGDGRVVTERLRAAVERLARIETPAEGGDVWSDALTQEVSRLPVQCCLVESGAFQVFCAESQLIPSVLQEIGRLRAVTFRAAGEGTDAELDLDDFDRRYLHLFSWDRERRQVVGAYRIGRTDQILAGHGVEGLYTRTLFRYDQRFIDRLSPALELGRSFVRAEYQRSSTALFLLWKGIGRFVTQHPEYKVLFGPVSISTRYSDSSHAMLKAFLEQNYQDHSLAGLVDAVNPFVPDRAMNPPPRSAPQTIHAANDLVAALEADGKGMPVLLRQYLKLNARLIGFNVDPDFGDALDALMMVDLTAVDPAILGRYLGRDDAARFLARHRSAGASRAA